MRMSSLQETLTFQQWVVDGTDDFISVLQNDLMAEKQTHMGYLDTISAIDASPYNNKMKEQINENNSELNKILSNLTQQDHQASEGPDKQLSEPQIANKQLSEPEITNKQLSEPERIDQMNENEMIDYLVDLMQEEPAEQKTKSNQQNNKVSSVPHYDNSCISQPSVVENIYGQNQMQLTQVKALPDTSMTQNGILENTCVQNDWHFKRTDQLPNTNISKTDAYENGNSQHTSFYGDFNQFQDSSLKTGGISVKSPIPNPFSNNDIMSYIIGSSQQPNQPIKTNQTNQISTDSRHQSFCQNERPNQKINQHSINQVFNKEDTRFHHRNIQHIPINKTIHIQNATANNRYKYTANNNMNYAQTTPAEKRVRAINTKKLLEIVQAQKRANQLKKEKAINTGPQNHQKSSLQEQEKAISTKSQIVNLSSKQVEIEKADSPTATKKRKKYEEDPKGDEEEEKKIFQAKKAKNYRDKKKEEFKMKDIQIKNLQEALEKCEREKKVYMDENKQLKEDLKKKDLLLQLYEVN